MSMRSSDTSRMVWALATRPNMSGVLIAASIRAMPRPKRYFTNRRRRPRGDLVDGLGE